MSDLDLVFAGGDQAGRPDADVAAALTVSGDQFEPEHVLHPRHLVDQREHLRPVHIPPNGHPVASGPPVRGSKNAVSVDRTALGKVAGGVPDRATTVALTVTGT